MNANNTRKLTRRETLVKSLKASFLAVFIAPFVMQTTSAELTKKQDNDYVPENDYPFFGWNPECESHIAVDELVLEEATSSVVVLSKGLIASCTT